MVNLSYPKPKIKVDFNIQFKRHATWSISHYYLHIIKTKRKTTIDYALQIALRQPVQKHKQKNKVRPSAELVNISSDVYTYITLHYVTCI